MNPTSMFLPGLTLLAALIVTPSPVVAQQDDSVARELGLTPEQNALPLWAKANTEDKNALGKFARAANQGIVVIGHPKIGLGTGFVISKKHRLIATNAHVADFTDRAEKIFAIPNGTSQPYQVERVWYHPGVRRRLNNKAALVIRSTNPADGPVQPNCPDLAVLQLSPQGPELAVELTMATDAELGSLFAQPVAMLGFPGHDNRAWPSIGESASATFHDGVVSRVTDFRLNGSALPADKQFVQYTMSTWGGFSGSPIFLPNGHVVAAHNMARYAKGKHGNVKSIAHGVRIDCLWELLVHHGLDDKVPIQVERSKVRVARWLAESPRDDRFRKAADLAEEAIYLIDIEKNNAKGVKLATQGIGLAPHYPNLYNIRYRGYLNYVFDNYRSLPKDVAIKQLGYARNDVKTYIRLAPSDPDGIMSLATVMNNTAVLTGDRNEYRRVIEMANRLLTINNMSDYLRATAHSVRALGYGNLDQHRQALSDHNTAVHLAPHDWKILETRADYHRSAGRIDLYRADQRKADELRKKFQRSP